MVSSARRTSEFLRRKISNAAASFEGKALVSTEISGKWWKVMKGEAAETRRMYVAAISKDGGAVRMVTAEDGWWRRMLHHGNQMAHS